MCRTSKPAKGPLDQMKWASSWAVSRAWAVPNKGRIRAWARPNKGRAAGLRVLGPRAEKLRPSPSPLHVPCRHGP